MLAFRKGVESPEEARELFKGKDRQWAATMTKRAKKHFAEAAPTWLSKVNKPEACQRCDGTHCDEDDEFGDRVLHISNIDGKEVCRKCVGDDDAWMEVYAEYKWNRPELPELKHGDYYECWGGGPVGGFVLKYPNVYKVNYTPTTGWVIQETLPKIGNFRYRMSHGTKYVKFGQ
jgi:hypothetical protein